MLTDLAREFQRSRDNGVFQRLFRRCEGPLRSFFRRLGYSPEEAEDFTQNVLLRVYRNIGEFRFDARFESWMYTIATNEWKNDLRRRSTLKRQAQEVSVDQVAKAEEDPDPSIELVTSETDPLTRLLRSEQAGLLREVLDQLTPQVRRCMLLRLDKGLKYREIASVLKLGVPTVKTHLRLGYERLRLLLDQQSRVLEAQEPPG